MVESPAQIPGTQVPAVRFLATQDIDWQVVAPPGPVIYVHTGAPIGLERIQPVHVSIYIQTLCIHVHNDS